MRTARALTVSPRGEVSASGGVSAPGVYSRGCNVFTGVCLSTRGKVCLAGSARGGCLPRGSLPRGICLRVCIQKGALHPRGWADHPFPRILSTSGRYASYWNAFLLLGMHELETLVFCQQHFLTDSNQITSLFLHTHVYPNFQTVVMPSLIQ